MRARGVVMGRKPKLTHNQRQEAMARREAGEALVDIADSTTCPTAPSVRFSPSQQISLDTFSGHSLRAGFLTSAAGKGASIFKMMDVSRHKSLDTLRGYVRDAELFKDHAGAGLL